MGENFFPQKARLGMPIFILVTPLTPDVSTILYLTSVSGMLSSMASNQQRPGVVPTAFGQPVWSESDT